MVLCIDGHTYADYSGFVSGTPRRITANLPGDLLDDAMKVTGKGITDTLVEGLKLVRRTRAYEKAMSLRGKVHLDVDLDVSRERDRR